MQCDFSGYATKAGLKCADGRTILAGAFKDQDQVKVPLVWQHQHKDSDAVLGHAMLEYRDNGDVYAYANFNKSTRAQNMREAVIHGDITMLSIWANELVERGGNVLHGKIRELSLVLSGANPGAVIENIHVAHSGFDETLDDEAIIYTGIPIVVGDGELVHADDDTTDSSDDEDEGGKTLQDVYENMSDEEKDVVHYMIGKALAAGKSDEKETTDEAKQDNVGDADDDKTLSHDTTDKDGSDMTTHNVFENNGEGVGSDGDKSAVLSHADISGIMTDAAELGTLSKAVEKYALSHGIENLEILFPEARAMTQTPEWDKRRTEWVSTVLNGCNKTPFSRVKTWTADITYEDARAKGYIKGDLKKEEWFSVASRETTPQTIYKKQKLDRDDIIDITDFDVVMWMKGEMRLMLDEELARAVLVGDGRDVGDADKIKEDKIRPVAFDDPYYTMQIGVNIDDANSSYEEVLDTILLQRQYWKGTGRPSFFTTEGFIVNCLLLRDAQGRKLYRNESELAAEMRVASLVPVEILEDYPDTIGVLVNLRDYTIGSDRGGRVTMFDDFDIDYNQEKYLIETRVSGALTKVRSAQHFYRTDSADAATTAAAPTWDPDTYTVTIPVDATVDYVDGNGDPIADGDTVLSAGDVLVVQAVPAAGYFLLPGKTRWSYMRPSA
jgi:hypothetical protein